MAESTRIPDFYKRRFDADARTNELGCRECGLKVQYDVLPMPVGELLSCPGCDLPSRIPTLPSQAGMAEPPDPPRSERS